MINPLLMVDGYKLGHHDQYPEGMNFLFSNFTARSDSNFRKMAVEKYIDGHIVVFGTSAVVQYIKHVWEEYFFGVAKEKVTGEFGDIVRIFLNDPSFSTQHVEDLHDLGYLPVEFNSLPEGTLCKIGVPFFTMHSTVDEFAWLVNYLETQLSAMIWKPVTSATIARHYKVILDDFYTRTCDNKLGMEFMVHDFSMRGLGNVFDAYFSGMGHLTSFSGSDNLPAFLGARDFYGFDVEHKFLAGGVPATEHSVTSSNIRAYMELDGVDNLEAEEHTIRYLVSKYPSGFLSYVSDTYDYFGVLTDVLPRLKNLLMARDGKFVVRPDTGNPIDIICGDKSSNNYAMAKGTLELLWDTFGGTYNEKGYRVLDSHIGLIYGDSITPQRMHDILERMGEMGFAASNVVFGAGSFTYQYTTRDTFGMACKATYCEVGNFGVKLFKDPKTGDGSKKSAKGMLAVVDGDLIDNLNRGEWKAISRIDQLKEINTIPPSFETIRERINATI